MIDMSTALPLFPSLLKIPARSPISCKPKNMYECSWPGCDKTFPSKANLKRHERTLHLREKRFVCPYPDCGKTCSRSDNLKQHMLVHTKRRLSDTCISAANAGREWDQLKALATLAVGRHGEKCMSLEPLCNVPMMDGRRKMSLDFICNPLPSPGTSVGTVKSKPTNVSTCQIALSHSPCQALSLYDQATPEPPKSSSRLKHRHRTETVKSAIKNYKGESNLFPPTPPTP